MRKLKIFNGRDWHCRGSLYIAAYSLKDAVDLVNAAYRKINGYEDRLDIHPTTICEAQKYWHKDCWGVPMNGVTPERGVWWTKEKFGQESKPERII